MLQLTSQFIEVRLARGNICRECLKLSLTFFHSFIQSFISLQNSEEFDYFMTCIELFLTNSCQAVLNFSVREVICVSNELLQNRNNIFPTHVQNNSQLVFFPLFQFLYLLVELPDTFSLLIVHLLYPERLMSMPNALSYSIISFIMCSYILT